MTTKEKQPSQVLGWAMHYALTRGWSIIPTKPDTKKAAGSWKQHQVVAARESKLEKWFGNGQDDGLAVVLGRCRVGWSAAIIDIQEAYDRWAAATSRFGGDPAHRRHFPRPACLLSHYR